MCGGPVKVCVCVGYGDLYLVKKAEPSYSIKIVLPEKTWYSSVQKKKQAECIKTLLACHHFMPIPKNQKPSALRSAQSRALEVLSKQRCSGDSLREDQIR